LHTEKKNKKKTAAKVTEGIKGKNNGTYGNPKGVLSNNVL